MIGFLKRWPLDIVPTNRVLAAGLSMLFGFPILLAVGLIMFLALPILLAVGLIMFLALPILLVGSLLEKGQEGPAPSPFEAEGEMVLEYCSQKASRRIEVGPRGPRKVLEDPPFSARRAFGFLYRRN